MPASILITGAAGFAGGHLLDLFAHDGVKVVAWCRPGGKPPRTLSHVVWQQVDLLDRDRVRDQLAATRPEFIYHCAGAAHVGQSWQSTESTFAVNVRGTHHLIEGLRDRAIQARVLIPSSGMVYSPVDEPLREDHLLRPNTPYGLSKLAQEMLGNGSGAPVSIARAFNHFGPRQDASFAASAFARQIAEIEAGRMAPEIAVGNLDARRDLTDVRDTVRAYRTILERGAPGRIYNVCSGRATSIRDLLQMLLDRSRVPIRVRVDPERFRPNDVPLVVGDPARIWGELGWKPAIPLEQTADDLLDFWRQS